MGATPTVGRAEPLDPGLGERLGDGTFDVLAGRSDHPLDPRRGMAEEVIDVPVADLALAAGEFPVAVDPGEPPGPNALPV